MRSRRYIRRTSLIIVGLGLFLSGLIVVRAFGVDFGLCASGVVFAICLITLRRVQRFFVISLLLCSALLLGVIRGSEFVDEISHYKSLYGQQISVYVTAREDAVYSERRQFVFSATNIELEQPQSKKLVGNIEVEGFGVPMVYKGDRLLVSGKLFPKRGDNVAGFRFANMQVVQTGQSKIDVLRRKFSAGMQNVLPEPLASLGLGILIGQRSTLPDDLTKQLSEVGLIHIVAVSGYNLTVIIYFSQRLLQKRSRFQAFVVSNTLIVLFLLVTGFSPSIVRAAVVSGISLVMWYYGRTMRPLMILLLAAVVTAGWNPLYIWSSIGWYLSFAAFFGVLVLGPLLHERFVPKKLQSRLLPQVLTETLSAQICTIPILLYIFSTFSLVSVFANLLVVPFIPFVMLAALVAGIYGMVGPFLLGGVLVLPARIMLSYIVEITQLFSMIPHASISVKFSAVQTGVVTLLIILLTLLLSQSTRSRLTSRPTGTIV